MRSSGTVGNKGNFCKKRHAAAAVPPLAVGCRTARAKALGGGRQAGSVAKVDNMQMNSSWKCHHASEIYASHNNQGMTEAEFFTIVPKPKKYSALIFCGLLNLETINKNYFYDNFRAKPMANHLKTSVAKTEGQTMKAFGFSQVLRPLGFVLMLWTLA